MENARICACYFLRSYPELPRKTAFDLLQVAGEGGRDNFTAKSTHPRAFFVDLRAEVLLFAVDFLVLSDETDASALESICEVLVTCLDDYSRNQRGDVGCTVRLAAMEAVRKHAPFLARITPQTYSRLLGKIVQQGAEKILRIREEAARTMLAFHQNTREDVPDAKKLMEIFKVNFRPGVRETKERIAKHLYVNRTDGSLIRTVIVSSWMILKVFV